MSYHQIEDITEDAIHLVSKADLSVWDKRDLIYNLYGFHDRFDTSYTRFRVLKILKNTRYLYEWPIEQHPDFADYKHLFEQYHKKETHWIPADFSADSASVFTKNGKVFFEAREGFWRRIKEQLPNKEQQVPKQIPALLLFDKLLQIGKQQSEAIFIKRWYATLVNSILDYEIGEQEGLPKTFPLWMQNESLLEIRNFAENNQKSIFLEDITYKDDDLLVLPDLELEEQFCTNADDLAKLRFLLDFKSTLQQIKDDYNQEVSDQPNLGKYELIYDFFREKLDDDWEDGLKDIGREKGCISFLTKDKVNKENNNEANYYCLIIDYTTDLKALNFRIGVQKEIILQWQNREVSASPNLQHFAELLVAFIDEKDWEGNQYVFEWGTWIYDIQQPKSTLMKILENVWLIYKTYSAKIYQFHGSSLLGWAGIEDSEALMKKRKKLLDNGYSFFGNEKDFQLAVACLNRKAGNPELVKIYTNEVEQLLSKGRGSEQLKRRIKQGLDFMKTNKEKYPEITTIYSGRYNH